MAQSAITQLAGGRIRQQAASSKQRVLGTKHLEEIED